MSNKRLRWGILGTGAIAKAFALAVAGSRTGELTAVGSRTTASAREFAEKFKAARAYGSYDDLLADPDVEAVYIATPHPFHAEWSIRAAQAGKHILCEKPLTMNLAEAKLVAEAARKHDVFLMEAFMYRCHPQNAKLVELIRGGAIGRVRVIEATFSFHATPEQAIPLFNRELGGGGILGVGCYTTSIARLLAGAALGRPFVNPTRLEGYGVLHPEQGTDLYAVAAVEFPGGILAQLSTGLGLAQNNGVRVYGSEGSLSVARPFLVPAGGTTIHRTRPGVAEPEAILVPEDASVYVLEADAVGDAIQAGLRECPLMTVEDSLGNMAALDDWRAKIGLTYGNEKPGTR